MFALERTRVVCTDVSSVPKESAVWVLESIDAKIRASDAFAQLPAYWRCALIWCGGQLDAGGDASGEDVFVREPELPIRFLESDLLDVTNDQARTMLTQELAHFLAHVAPKVGTLTPQTSTLKPHLSTLNSKP